MSIIINPEFESLIPPLSEDEFRQLEENCVRDGIRDPLVVWPQEDGNQILVDGHNRFKIAAGHGGIPFNVKQMQFDNPDDAKAWIIRNQFGRRNLSAYDRSLLALKLKPIISKEAKKNQGSRNDIRQKSDKSTDTKKELAKVAGVSHDTIHKVEKIEQEAPPEVRQAVKEGRMTINAGYLATRPKQDKKARVNLAKEEHAAFEEAKKGSGLVDLQAARVDESNRKIIAHATVDEIEKIVFQIENFSAKYKPNDLTIINTVLSLEDRAHLGSRIEKCRMALLMIEKSI